MKTQHSSIPFISGVLLSGALLLAGCGPRGQENQLPTEPVASPPAPSEAPTEAAPTPTPASAPKSRMTATISKGTLTVTLNGRKVGDYPSYLKTEVTPYVQTGENLLEVSWQEPSTGSVKIEYALDAAPEKFLDIANVFLSTSDTKKPGSKKLTFNLPNPDGTLPPLATAAPTPTEEKTVDDIAAKEGTLAPSETAAPAGKTPPPTEAPTTAPAKPDNGIKAIVSASADNSPFALYLNGTKVGDYQSFIRVNVGQYLKIGPNTMKVIWKERTGYLSAKIAVFSPSANDYQDASKVTLYSSDTRKPGERTVSFNVNGPEAGY